jgi:DNA (cytosine-5)-methyltransferase 1
MRNYLNEHDPHAAQWLRNLMADGLISEGKVDDRSIADVSTDDVRGFTQCHWFAGIAGWCEALRIAGWPADRPVWTGSCPCQPFSSPGKRKGQQDERHLWPEMFRLIRGIRPPVVFGEQVASAIGHGWFDGIRADLEGEGYAVWGAVLGAHSVGGCHVRQRLYWAASDSTVEHGRSHDLLVEGGIRRAPQPVGRLPRVSISQGRWSSDQGATAEPLLVPNRNGLSSILAGIGNAIVPQVAAVFIKAFMQAVKNGNNV